MRRLRHRGSHGAALVIALATAFAPALSWAGPDSNPPRRAIALFVDPSLTDLDSEALRRAVSEELDEPVELTTTRPDRDALLVLAGDGRTATVSFRSADRVTERAVDLPADRVAAIDTVAWMAGNVARDEAAELVAEMSRSADPPAGPVAVVAPRPDAAKPSAPPPAREHLPPCRRPLDRLPVGVELAPRVGTSSWFGNDGVHAASVGAIAGLGRGARGAQVGGVAALEREFVCGAQIGGVVAFTGGEVVGAQVGGVATVAGSLDGGQVSVVNVSRGDARGAQAGLVNAGGSMTGVQLGLINLSAGPVRGLQLGLLNYAEDSDASVGLITVVRNGRTHVEARGSEWGVVSATVQHGGQRLYNRWGMCARLAGSGRRGAFVLGLGSHFALSQRFWIDPDMSGYVFALGEGAIPVVAELAIPIGLQIHRHFAVYAGPAYRVGVVEGDEELDLGPLSHREIYSDGVRRVRGSPGAIVGLRGL